MTLHQAIMRRCIELLAAAVPRRLCPIALLSGYHRCWLSSVAVIVGCRLWQFLSRQLPLPQSLPQLNCLVASVLSAAVAPLS